jgi:hypothetical protein
MSHLPFYVSFVFILTVSLTISLFYLATKKSVTTLVILISWLVLQAAIGLTGFYTITKNIPPRFILLVLPPILLIIMIFSSKKGRMFIEGIDIRILTLLHTVRLPVELVLWWLFLNQAVPRIMTFEGRNLDVLAGLTAPIIYYYGFRKKKTGSSVVLFWNFLCLALLINIILLAVLSAPFPFQRLGFEQPNIAVLYFPYLWLPGCVVPLILFSHLVAIWQLLIQKK